MKARQVSRRAGEMICQDLGGYVAVAGAAVTYMSGKISFNRADVYCQL